MEKYNEWLEKAVGDPDLIPELKSMDEAQKEDAFYRDLAFGTGGLRGVIGAGTNRMNVYTVAKASQGLANYVNAHFENPSIAISYDSRIKSDLFSKVAAGVFKANGIHTLVTGTVKGTLQYYYENITQDFRYDSLTLTPCIC